MRGGIFQADVPEKEARERVDAEPSMVGRDLAREVTIAAPKTYEGDGSGPRIVALDTGIKRSIIRNFTQRGATLEIYPCTTSAEELLATDPDGFFLVPGPGDPAALDYIVENIRTLLTTKPVFGICLGHQLLVPGRRPGDVQAPVRPPRRQPPGQGPPDRPDRDHVAEPRLRGQGRARRDHPVRARRGPAHPREPLRRHDRRDPLARRPRRLRPVPPGGGTRARTTPSASSTSSSERSRMPRATTSRRSSSSAPARSSSARPPSSTTPARRPARSCSRRATRSCS